MDEQDKELNRTEIGRKVIEANILADHNAETVAINQNPEVGSENDRIEKKGL
ncbi:hypothetical protein [Ammoniphilus sp. 3BR4]|uniref:hypothetical protein n=1 Tax=Ammoniphilus sp. 3BR4 TaxID=3158265 RepID=UPI0034674773